MKPKSLLFLSDLSRLPGQVERRSGRRRLPVFRLVHHFASDRFEIIWHNLNIVSHSQQELVNRHLAPWPAGLLTHFFASLTKKNGLWKFFWFRARGIQNRDAVLVVLNQSAATVASYFRAWIPGLIELNYDCHSVTLRHPTSSATGYRAPRLKKLAQVRDFCMIRSSKFPTNDQTEARCFSEVLYTRIVC